VLAAQPVTTNLLKFMRASIKMIGVSNLQSFIASMTQKLTLSDISDESKDRKSGSAGMPRPISYAVFCLNKKLHMKSEGYYSVSFSLCDSMLLFYFLKLPLPPISTLFPYTTLFRSVLAAQPVTTNLLKFMRASIKMIGVSNLQSFIASMTQKLTLSDISDES